MSLIVLPRAFATAACVDAVKVDSLEVDSFKVDSFKVDSPLPVLTARSFVPTERYPNY